MNYKSLLKYEFEISILYFNNYIDIVDIFRWYVYITKNDRKDDSKSDLLQLRIIFE